MRAGKGGVGRVEEEGDDVEGGFRRVRLNEGR